MRGGGKQPIKRTLWQIWILEKFVYAKLVLEKWKSDYDIYKP